MMVGDETVGDGSPVFFSGDADVFLAVRHVDGDSIVLVPDEETCV